MSWLALLREAVGELARIRALLEQLLADRQEP